MASYDSAAYDVDAYDTDAYDITVAATEPAQPVLPVNRPNSRSIDARTLADSFNRGQPIEPDYTWPGGRKFYQ